jgi:hypothetical protein
MAIASMRVCMSESGLLRSFHCCILTDDHGNEDDLLDSRSVSLLSVYSDNSASSQYQLTQATAPPCSLAWLRFIKFIFTH